LEGSVLGKHPESAAIDRLSTDRDVHRYDDGRGAAGRQGIPAGAGGTLIEASASPAGRVSLTLTESGRRPIS
jgi:hypothetical protein